MVEYAAESVRLRYEHHLSVTTVTDSSPLIVETRDQSRESVHTCHIAGISQWQVIWVTGSCLSR